MTDKLKLPPFAAALVQAQNEYDSTAFSLVFAKDAVVHDEGKLYTGQGEIKKWNEGTNSKYQTKLAPLNFSGDEKEAILTSSMSGNFDGSPIIIKHHFTLHNRLIKSLTIKS